MVLGLSENTNQMRYNSLLLYIDKVSITAIAMKANNRANKIEISTRINETIKLYNLRFAYNTTEVIYFI
jgi:hypothetical protein